MPYYVIQTALLLLGAFLVGAWIACLLRRAFGRSRTAVPAGAGAVASTQADTAIAPPEVGESIFGPRSTEEQAALDRSALTDDPTPQPSVADVEPVSPTTDLDVVEPAVEEVVVAEPEPVETASEAPERTVELGPEPQDETSDVAHEQPLGEPASEPEIDADTGERGVSSADETPETLSSPSMDEVEDMGVEQEPVQEDVADIATEEDLPINAQQETIEEENAVVALEEGDPTDGEDQESAIDVAGPALAAAAVAASVVDEPTQEPDTIASAGPVIPVADGPPNDLTQIRGIDDDTQGILNAAGIYRYDQLLGLTADGVAGVSSSLGSPARISREGWIEQAAILARGGETHFSRRKNRSSSQSSGDQAAAATSDSALVRETQEPASGGHAAVQSPAIGSDPSHAERKPGPDEDRTAREPRDDQPPRSEREPRTDRPDRDLRVEREPRPERSEREPRPDRADREPQPAREPIGLNTSRTSGLTSTGVGTGAVTAGQRRVSGSGAMVQSSEADDLKRIRGVGVVIEKKLNAMGISTYAQIANWQDSDIAEVNNILDFSGRIERENWIEQARVLSGQT